MAGAAADIQAAICAAKHRFETRALAMSTATRANRLRTRLKVYRCEVCAGYHHTHAAGKEINTR
jgi:hypothetical protein